MMSANDSESWFSLGHQRSYCCTATTTTTPSPALKGHLFTSHGLKNGPRMTSSVNAQDESNPALWLATRAGKIELSCPLGTTRRVPQEKFPRKLYYKCFIGQACSVKMAGYWPRTFFASLWTSTPSRFTNTQKKRTCPELEQYPAILTWHLVNNSYIIYICLMLRSFFERSKVALYSVVAPLSFDPQCLQILQ